MAFCYSDRHGNAVTYADAGWCVTDPYSVANACRRFSNADADRYAGWGKPDTDSDRYTCRRYSNTDAGWNTDADSYALSNRQRVVRSNYHSNSDRKSKADDPAELWTSVLSKWRIG